MEIKLPKDYYLKSDSNNWSLGKYREDKNGEKVFFSEKYYQSIKAAFKEFLELGVRKSEDFEEARKFLYEFLEIKKQVEKELDLNRLFK